jgi:glycosyltransferase involved in cell wall biosynthesis
MKKKNDNILILAGGGYIFGAETVTLSIIKFLNKQFPVHCAVNGWNDGQFIKILKEFKVEFTEIKLGWIYIRKPMWTFDTLINAPLGYFKYFKLIKKWNPAIIYHTNYRTLFQLFPLIKQNNVYHVHDMLSGTIGEKILRLTDKKVIQYIAVSESIKNDLLKCGIKESKIKVIYNGIEFENNETDIYPFQKNGYFSIGIVGQIVSRKGHALLFEALSSSRLSAKKFKLNIYGSGNEEYIHELKKLAEEKFISDSIVFHGYVNDKSAIYNSVDFCVVPSIEPEPFGLTVIEPAVYEKTTIASNIGAIGEIINNKETGLLFNPENVDTLIDQLLFIMDNPEKIIELGKKAKVNYDSKFSDKKMNEDTNNLLETYLNRFN